MNTPIVEPKSNTKNLRKWNQNKPEEIKLSPTIERLVPDAFLGSPYASQREIAQQHFRRYKKACEYVQGGRVLDIACGVGYGSRMIRDAGATEFPL